jgi:hypothetical protein
MRSILARAPASASLETMSTIAAAASEAEVVARYDGRAPRCTSYPTAPHFTPAVDAEVYERWLGELPLDAALSLLSARALLRSALSLLRLQYLRRPA